MCWYRLPGPKSAIMHEEIACQESDWFVGKQFRTALRAAVFVLARRHCVMTEGGMGHRSLALHHLTFCV